MSHWIGTTSLLVLSCLAACRPSVEARTEDRLETSHRAWDAAKHAHGERYWYSRSHASFAGFRTVTTLQIDKGWVVARRFEAVDSNGATGFVERGSEVGTKQGPADPPLTIDVLYDECKRVLSLDPQANTIRFSLDDAGLLRECTYVPQQCQDDCGQGVAVERFGWGDMPD